MSLAPCVSKRWRASAEISIAFAFISGRLQTSLRKIILLGFATAGLDSNQKVRRYHQEQTRHGENAGGGHDTDRSGRDRHGHGELHRGAGSVPSRSPIRFVGQAGAPPPSAASLPDQPPDRGVW